MEYRLSDDAAAYRCPPCEAEAFPEGERYVGGVRVPVLLISHERFDELMAEPETESSFAFGKRRCSHCGRMYPVS